MDCRHHAKAHDALAVREVSKAVGSGLFATRPLPAGTKLFEEYPIIAMQHDANRAAGAAVCERCFRFLGPLESQFEALLRGKGASLETLPAKLPAEGPLAALVSGLPSPVGCPGGCGLRFCSAQCAQANFDEHHCLLCRGSRDGAAAEAEATADGAKRGRTDGDAAAERATNPRISAAAASELDAMLSEKMTLGGSSSGGAGSSSGGAGGSSGGAGSSAGGEEAAAEEELELVPGSLTAWEREHGGASASTLPADLLARFEAHARGSNEIFLLAAKACALVLCQLEGGASYEAAMAPFASAPAWWDAVACPDETDEESFRLTLRQLITESWILLTPALAHRAPAGCPLFGDVSAYAVVVGAFERRNCAVSVASPVEEYLIQADELPPGPAREAVLAVTKPLLGALGDACATGGHSGGPSGGGEPFCARAQGRRAPLVSPAGTTRRATAPASSRTRPCSTTRASPTSRCSSRRRARRATAGWWRG